jgi:hypothetical protein
MTDQSSGDPRGLDCYFRGSLRDLQGEDCDRVDQAVFRWDLTHSFSASTACPPSACPNSGAIQSLLRKDHHTRLRSSFHQQSKPPADQKELTLLISAQDVGSQLSMAASNP